MALEKSQYQALLSNLGIQSEDDHELFFSEVSKQDGLKRDRKYIEEHRMHFLNQKYQLITYVQGHDYFGLRCLFDLKSQSVMIDPWELIDSKFGKDFQKIKETTADHVYFNVLYSIPPWAIDELRFSILKLLEFCQLFPSYETTTYNAGYFRENFARVTFASRNRFCLHCGKPLILSEEFSVPLFCHNGSKNSKQKSNCLNTFQRSQLSKYFIEKVISQDQDEYKQYYSDLTKKIIAYTQKVLKHTACKPIQGYQPELSVLIDRILTEEFVISLLSSHGYKSLDSVKDTVILNPVTIYRTIKEIIDEDYPGLDMSWAKYVIQQFLVEARIRRLITDLHTLLFYTNKLFSHKVSTKR